MTQPDLANSDLLSRLRNRDPETLESLVREHSRPLYRTARGMGFREDEAEDMVQDVFATFLGSIERFEGRSQVRTWLFGILHHKTLERWRQKEQESKHDPIDDVFESRFDAKGSWAEPPRDLVRLMESRELGQAIANCLENLPASQRATFVLREMEGMETAEICKILEVSVTHMGVLMHRARNHLRECLEGRGWRRPG